MSGRFGKLALDAAGRHFGITRRKLNDDEKMRYGACDIHRKGAKYHVYDGGKRIGSYDSLDQARGCVDDRARRGKRKKKGAGAKPLKNKKNCEGPPAPEKAPPNFEEMPDAL